MDLGELGPGGGRSSGEHVRGWFERLAEVREDLPDQCRFCDEGDETDVAAA
jgi:hypothetical protein